MSQCLKWIRPCLSTFFVTLSLAFYPLYAAASPNIILMMADDLGYGDTGFNGNNIIHTPHLDQMAKAGLNLTHFYATGPVCSPTRGSFLTGRHYLRFGIFGANQGHLPEQEWTLAKMLKQKGYATGHFGKWHVGTLNPNLSSKGVKRKPKANFAPPWQASYDQSFVTESAVATWDPGLGKRAVNNPFYLNGEALRGDDPRLKGGASKVVMDQALPFIEQAVSNKTPFLAVIWFHAPHEDLVAGPAYLAKYKTHGEKAHYYGAVSELDDQVGRLRQKLEKLGVADDTLLLFTSDNSPEKIKKNGRRAGETSGLRARKRSLYEGGVRVPTLVVWPGKIAAQSESAVPMSTLDLLPTVQHITAASVPDKVQLDGENVWPIWQGKHHDRTTVIPFFYKKTASLVQGEWKLVVHRNGEKALFNLKTDRAEQRNMARQYPALVASLFHVLTQKYFVYRQSYQMQKNKTSTWPVMAQFEREVSL